MKNKELAYNDFVNMIECSWTFGRMTDAERSRCFDSLHAVPSLGLLRGNYDARFDILHAVYRAFLMGLGYDGPAWREAGEVC